ncbi:MAG: phosphoglycolate phosphatase [Burkholderiales bacterium RIFCSPLOWO2_12_FULL_61_40]|nr:MAG: phosphoglycolate phosphatase [Burkholderiales bacterium RIFCSPLOWO2_12_FULL_61_40]
MQVFQGITAVLFDLDGTLIDSAPDLGAAADQMRLDRGLSSLALECYRPMAGAGARGMLGVAFDLSTDDPAYESMREEFFCNYEKCMSQRTVMFDEVAELIRQIDQRQLLWGVVTNKSARFTVPLTQAMPLFATARAIVSGDTTPHAKPHPAPLLEAAQRLGVNPSQCLYVGDDERDVVAGNAAGMYTVAATYGYLGSQSDTQAWGAHAEINSPLALLQLLANA